MMSPKENPGLNKLIEEMGEALQIAGKLLAYPDGEHPDGAGNLHDRLSEELGDVLAAIAFCREEMFRYDQLSIMTRRKQEKLLLFRSWHDEAPSS